MTAMLMMGDPEEVAATTMWGLVCWFICRTNGFNENKDTIRWPSQTFQKTQNNAIENNIPEL